MIFEGVVEEHSDNAYKELDEDDEIEESEDTFEFFLPVLVKIRQINSDFNKMRDWIIKYEKVVCSHQKID